MNKTKSVSFEAVYTLGLINGIKIEYKKDNNKPIVENNFLQ